MTGPMHSPCYRWVTDAHSCNTVSHNSLWAVQGTRCRTSFAIECGGAPTSFSRGANSGRADRGLPPPRHASIAL